MKLFTVDELYASTRRQQAMLGHRLRVTTIGRSWKGRPIEMLSLGRGSRSALLVGTPHPNEPIGASTIERMIDEIVQSGEPSFMGFEWHFIKTIDPEGLAACRT